MNIDNTFKRYQPLSPLLFFPTYVIGVLYKRVNIMRVIHEQKLPRPDSKGRVTLGNLAKDISSFKVRVDTKTHEIVLTPYAEIPLREKGLLGNESAMSFKLLFTQEADKSLGHLSKFPIRKKPEISSKIS